MRKQLTAIILVLGAVACSQPSQQSSVSEGVDTPSVTNEVERVGIEGQAVPASLNLPPAGSMAILKPGVASIDCGIEGGQRHPITSLKLVNIMAAVEPCEKGRELVVYYTGEINNEFTSLMEMLDRVAGRDVWSFGRHLLIDSGGGNVEEAIRAGDLIADAGWGIIVPKDSQCLSACVLILAAGETRGAFGSVGVHRIFPVSSNAKTRGELDADLQKIGGRVKEFFRRNGVNPAIADFMMTIPTGKIRVLSANELEQYGLGMVNAAQQDVERVALVRKCGMDFVRRKEAFANAFKVECLTQRDFDIEKQCGFALRSRFGFPDPKCLAEGPMAYFE